MFFSKVSLLAFAAISGVLAAPELAKRGPETIHFADCTAYTAIDYYADDDNSVRFPGNDNTCVPSVSPSFGEGSGTHSCTFPTNVGLTWSLNSNARNTPLDTIVGSANNGFKTFVCKRAGNRILYTDGNGNQCRDIYYCRPVNSPSQTLH
ncbi:hypothetical protein F4801DRAFT_583538 [Xylaria longipes]|nr:hypothetical protein F4801DRAFT_583538 [Xylaria longipes]RYC59970.1 hypothetical protein CHU98_g6236 [Xylaria longipes]